ncbi:hypothetical protein [Mycobacterium sp. JS623]|uniref:hypothetical protein n=1 Tax=Mycobacterium sp. JS623 TaxID=212767 RepID=UPI0002FBFFD1|nr:hypothetical protein [Mycobacterium sp. JS623]
MNTKRTAISRRGVKLIGGVCAAAAVLGAGVLTLALDNGGASHTSTLAGSGDAPTNTVYVQPSVSAMTMGATATFTTPATVEPTTEAVPPVKAGS